MKSSVDEAVWFIKKYNLSPEMLVLMYNDTRTKAKVIYEDSNIQASFFMNVDNAKKFIEDVKKKYYETSK